MALGLFSIVVPLLSGAVLASKGQTFDPVTYHWPGYSYTGWTEENGSWTYHLLQLSESSTSELSRQWRSWFSERGWQVRPFDWIAQVRSSYLEEFSEGLESLEGDMSLERFEQMLRHVLNGAWHAENRDFAATLKIFQIPKQLLDEFRLEMEAGELDSLPIPIHKLNSAALVHFTAFDKHLCPPRSILEKFVIPIYPRVRKASRTIFTYPMMGLELTPVLQFCVAEDGLEAVCQWYMTRLKQEGWIASPILSSRLLSQGLQTLRKMGYSVDEFDESEGSVRCFETLLATRKEERCLIYMSAEPNGSTYVMGVSFRNSLSGIRKGLQWVTGP